MRSVTGSPTLLGGKGLDQESHTHPCRLAQQVGGESGRLLGAHRAPLPAPRGAGGADPSPAQASAAFCCVPAVPVAELAWRWSESSAPAGPLRPGRGAGGPREAVPQPAFGLTLVSDVLCGLWK